MRCKTLFFIAELLLASILRAPASAAEPALSGPSASTPATAANSAEQTLPAPFRVSKDEQAVVDRILERWERWNADAKTFECRFKRWTYDSIFGKPGEATFVELGQIHYAVPGRSAMRVDQKEVAGQTVPIGADRAERWQFDGKSVYGYNAASKRINEYALPPDIQKAVGRAADGPLAFASPYAGVFSALFHKSAAYYPIPFGARANDLKHQYYLRETTPANAKGEQLWLEAFPRNAALAANFDHLQLILAAKDASPIAIRIVQPNQRDCIDYQFYSVVVNGVSPQAADDWFRPTVPAGWSLISDPMRGARTTQNTHTGKR
jgi:TIGR03009 family protein